MSKRYLSLIAITVVSILGCKGLDFGGSDEKTPIQEQAPATIPNPTNTTLPTPTKPEDQKSSVGGKDEEKVLTASDFQFSILEKDYPNEYELKIIWPKVSGEISISKNQENIAQIGALTNGYSIYLDGGEKFDINIEYKTKEEGKGLKFQKTINIPLDYVVSTDVMLKQDFEFKGNRFFLQNRATIKTETFNVNINVNEFISDNGSIVTLSNNLKAPIETNGRSGGTININTKSARGRLNVMLNGESGGDGRPGYKSQIGGHTCVGTNAGNGGDAGYFGFKAVLSDKFEIEQSVMPGNKGIGGLAGSVDPNFPSSLTSGPYDSCPRGNINGTDGRPGNGKACYKLTFATETICNSVNGPWKIINLGSLE